MQIDNGFHEIKTLIDQARTDALKSVNVHLIQLYWKIGNYISQKLSESQWGDKKIDQLAVYLNSCGPDYKGFNRRNLYRMRQFYESYQDAEIVSPLVTQLGWSHHFEALDRDVRKPHENPSIGVLLCKGKDDEVVEYALSRSLAPAKIADYTLKLPDKKQLRQKLHELFENISREEGSE